jgi:hypothetical protein
MEYQKEDALSLPERIAKGELRLDEDEREHAIFLSKMSGLAGRQLPHVESIHLHKSTSDIELIPTRFRIPLLRIMMEYTKGFTKLEGDAWVPTDSPEWL